MSYLISLLGVDFGGGRKNCIIFMTKINSWLSNEYKGITVTQTQQ
jgi:hypothetical protein